MTLSLQQRELTVAAIVGLLMTFVGWSAWAFASARESALAVAAGLQDCQRLAEKIRTGRRLTPRAANQPQSEAEVTVTLEQAVRHAGLAANSLASIEPQPGRHLSDSPYRIQTTQVSMNSVPLPGLMKLLHQVVEDDPAQIVSNLRLAVPNRGSNPSSGNELWLADFTLTRLVYDPIIRPSQPSRNSSPQSPSQ